MKTKPVINFSQIEWCLFVYLILHFYWQLDPHGWCKDVMPKWTPLNHERSHHNSPSLPVQEWALLYELTQRKYGSGFDQGTGHCKCKIVKKNC